MNCSGILLAVFSLAVFANPPSCFPQQEKAADQTFDSPPADVISYRISLRPLADRTDLAVRMSFTGDESGKGTISIPTGRFGTPGIPDSIGDIQVEGATVRREPENPATLFLAHEANAAITVNYRVSTNPQASEGAYRPSTSQTHFHYFGSQWRLSIRHSGQRKYRFEFADVPDGWVVYGNPGSGRGPYTLRAEDSEISGYIAGGDYESAEIRVQGTPISIFVSRSFPQSAEIIRAAESIVTRQGELFGGFDREFFVISMTPREDIRAGVAIDNAFVCFVDPETVATEIEVLIAHEAFHNWLPGKGTIDRWKDGTPVDEFRLDWFVEGFTEFVARQMLLESGRMSHDQFVDKFNDDLREQAKNPMQRASLTVVGQALRDRRYTNHHERTSYFRGPLIALKVDRQLKGKGHPGVMGVVQEFLDAAEKSGGTIEEGAFFELFDRNGVDLRAIYREHIVYGNPVVPGPDAFGPDYATGEAVFERAEQGFDSLYSRLSGVVRGVELDSPAWTAGLRDGMIFERAELSREAGRASRVFVRDAPDESAATRIIEYQPAFSRTTTVRFVAREK